MTDRISIITGLRAGVVSLFVLLLLFAVLPAAAQNGAMIPSQSHYNSYRLIEQGRFADALSLCRQEIGSGTKVGQHRWIDSICYYAMLGEVLYIRGNLSEALEAYESAIDIYMNNPDWIARVTYPTGTGSSEAAVPPWGTGSRNLSLSVFPHDAMIQIGDPITEERLKQGGMMKNPELKKIDPEEIFRCTALSLRRRNEILGPLAPSDHRSRQIVECFAKRPVTRNHWSNVFLDVLFGIALEGAGKDEEAADMLSKSLLYEGELDHFLAAPALLTLGDIYFKNGKPFEAADSYFEASVSAFAYGNTIYVEESVRKMMHARRLLNDQTIPEFPIAEAASWASNQPRSAFLAMSFTLLTAEKLFRSGDAGGAETAVRHILHSLSSQGLDGSQYADLCRYLAAALAYLHGNISEGAELLAAMRKGVMQHSLRFFQIGRLNVSLADITPRTAFDLYAELLRISDLYDWSAEPAAAFTADTCPWEEELGNMFLIALDRDQKDRAFEIAERIRVRRFLTSLDMGGRLFSLRYLMTAPEKNLSEEERALRQNILVDYPGFAELEKRSMELKTALTSFSVNPETEKERETEDCLNELESISAKEETMLSGIAVMPFAIPEIFPARYDLAALQMMIPEKSGILSFIEIDRNLYGFLVTREIFDVWRVGSSDQVSSDLAVLLTKYGAGKQRHLKEIEEDGWKETGSRFFTELLGNPSSSDPRGTALFEHLAIVPDSFLWYTPFDALTLPKGDELIPIAAVPNFTLFCAPAVSLAFSLRETKTGDLRAETVVLPGKLHPKEGSSSQEEFMEQLKKCVTNGTSWTGSSFRVSDQTIASQISRLLCMREISSNGPEWIPISAPSKGKGTKAKGSPIGDWRFLPWGGPTLALFPGFRSDAETGLRNGGDGSEFFAPLLILESQGAETVLISRWRVGGKSAYDLVSSFLEKEGKTDPASAWKETAVDFIGAPLNLKEEPSFKGTPPKTAPNGENPFFWGGYMLVCRGFLPQAAEMGNEPEDPAEEREDNNAEGENIPNEGEPNMNPEEKGREPESEKDSDGSESEDTEGAPEEDSAEVNSAENGSMPAGGSEPPKKPKKDRTRAKPSTNPAPKSSSPITDEQIEEEDRNAEDFYKRED